MHESERTEDGPKPTPAAIGALLRDYAPQVLGIVARRSGQFDASEDAVQEALLAASLQWPEDGVPDHPRAWLVTVASRRLVDLQRSEAARREREQSVARETPEEQPGPDARSDHAPDDDDTLTLFLLCCHPALSPTSQVALTLRAVGGLTTAQVAAAFLVPEATMAQRISRAKQSIKTSKIAFALPTDSERASRLNAVLHVLYLVFNEGYTSSGGDALHRTDLSNEAIRLTRALRQALPRSSDVAGLLALMLLTDARRSARATPDGDLVPLDEQDRTRWDRRAIAEGIALVNEALSDGSIGLYQVQAAIAALHDEAARAEDTDWPQILALYEVLRGISDNPVVALNHAVADAMVHGPASALALLDALDEDSRIRGHYRLDAVRGHLLERMGDVDAAIARYRAAAQRTASTPEKNYLLTKAARLADQRRASS